MLLFTEELNSLLMPSNGKHIIIFSFYLRLFCLFNLEELDISYNSMAFIPNEIQKLRYFGSNKYPQDICPLRIY